MSVDICTLYTMDRTLSGALPLNTEGADRTPYAIIESIFGCVQRWQILRVLGAGTGVACSLRATQDPRATVTMTLVEGELYGLTESPCRC